jgi:deazaflavin-dependent oxidoreductase (nitroreductase family)
MPMPRWLAHINKRVFNPLEIKRGTRPVLIHTGRSSGTTYQTPLDAHPIEGGYLFLPIYGPRTDWVRNVLAAGTARLRIEGREIELASPRLVNQDEARRLLPPTTKIPPGTSAKLGILRMDVGGQG